MLRTGGQIGHRAPIPPLGNRLGIDSMPTSQGPKSLLAYVVWLDGTASVVVAPVQNWSHGAAFHLVDKNAPSNAGTKHPYPHSDSLN